MHEGDNDEKHKQHSRSGAVADWFSKIFFKTSVPGDQITAEQLALATGSDIRVPGGSCVAEAAIWLDWKHQGRLVSEDHGTLYGVNAEQLGDCVKECPEAMRLCV